MIQDIRFAYNEYSMLAALHLLAALFIMGIAITGLHALAWFFGSPVGLFDNPPLATALKPIMAALTPPGLGCTAGFVANFVAHDDHDDARLLVGNAVGQIACVLAIPFAITASMANLSVM